MTKYNQLTQSEHLYVLNSDFPAGFCSIGKMITNGMKSDLRLSIQKIASAKNFWILQEKLCKNFSWILIKIKKLHRPKFIH